MKTIIFLVSLLISSLSFAGRPELIAVATDQGGYPAKSMCFFSNNYMVAHPEGLLILYTCFGGPDINSEIWLVKEKPVNVGTSTMGNLFTPPFLQGTDIFFFEYTEFETVALWKFSQGLLSSVTIPEALKRSHIHDLALVGDQFFFRYTNRSHGEHGEGIFDGNFTILPQRGTEFYYKASGNGEIMLQKTKLAGGEAIELRTKDHTSPRVILKDMNLDTSSPFKFFRSQFALRGNRWATFATTDKGLVVIRGENAAYTTEDISAHFKDIQHWPPALTENGEVLFRGTDHEGTFALWGYKDGKKRLILGSGEEITVGNETVVTSSRSLMYNSPVIDQNGKIFIGVGLRSPDASADFGQGVLSF